MGGRAISPDQEIHLQTTGGLVYQLGAYPRFALSCEVLRSDAGHQFRSFARQHRSGVLGEFSPGECDGVLLPAAGKLGQAKQAVGNFCCREPLQPAIVVAPQDWYGGGADLRRSRDGSGGVNAQEWVARVGNRVHQPLQLKRGPIAVAIHALKRNDLIIRTHVEPLRHAVGLQASAVDDVTDVDAQQVGLPRWLLCLVGFRMSCSDRPR